MEKGWVCDMYRFKQCGIPPERATVEQTAPRRDRIADGCFTEELKMQVFADRHPPLDLLKHVRHGCAEASEIGQVGSCSAVRQPVRL